MGSQVVVDVGEAVQLGLQVGEGGRGGLGGEPAFLSLVEAFDGEEAADYFCSIAG